MEVSQIHSREAQKWVRVNYFGDERNELFKFGCAKAALRLEEDELTNDVFGVWFTFVCCAVNKQSWSTKPNSSGSTCQGLLFLHPLLFYWKDILQQKSVERFNMDLTTNAKKQSL